MLLFVVRDVKADAYGAPMSVATKGLALRSFTEACLDPRSEMNKYPEDYMLYVIGQYEPNTGCISPFPVPEFVASASEVIESRKRVVEAPKDAGSVIA